MAENELSEEDIERKVYAAKIEKRAKAYAELEEKKKVDMFGADLIK